MNKENILPELSAYFDIGLTAEEVLQWSREIEWESGQVGGQDQVIKKVRDCSTKRLLPLSEKINLIVSEYLLDYAKDHNLKDLKLNQYSLVRYTEGQFFLEHSDGEKNMPRRVSMVIYLNDDYDGGEISFTRFETTIKPKAQTLIFFPSTEEYSHAALPITSGTKYALTGFWF
jgi:predicted 2-oxoglutarate/Fe(II)-dependent dioxygenase YbiX